MVMRPACHEPLKQWIHDRMGGYLVHVPFRPVGLMSSKWHGIAVGRQLASKAGQGRAGQGRTGAGHLQAEVMAGHERQSCH